MKRIAFALIVIGLVASACTTADRFAPKLGPAQVLVRVDGVTVLAVDGTNVSYRDPATGETYRIAAVPVRSADSLDVTDPDGNVYVAKGSRIIEGNAVVSDGWDAPFAFSIDRRNRMYVADQERISHGAREERREAASILREVAHRVEAERPGDPR